MAYLLEQPEEEVSTGFMLEEPSQMQFQEPTSAEQPMNRFQSILNSLLKGVASGAESLGRMFGPLEVNPMELQQAQQERQKLYSQYLPSQEGMPEEAAKRFGQAVPMLGAGGGSLAQILSRAATGAGAGATVKELGAPEVVADIAEIAATLRPSLSKKIQPKASQQEFVDFLRSKGATEEQIAPLLQEGKSAKIFQKYAIKGEKTQNKIESTKKVIDNIYDKIMTGEQSAQKFKPEIENKLVSSIEDIMKNKLSNEERELIKGDWQAFLDSGKSIKNAMKLNLDINSLYSKNKKLQLLKKPIKQAILNQNPSLSKEYDLVNKAFVNYYDISKRLKPTMISEFYEATIPYQLIGSLMTGNIPLIKGALGAYASKKIATEMVVNPRLKNLSSKMVSALNLGKYQVANKIKNQLESAYRQIDPKLGDYIHDVDFEEFYKNSEQ